MEITKKDEGNINSLCFHLNKNINVADVVTDIQDVILRIDNSDRKKYAEYSPLKEKLSHELIEKLIQKMQEEDSLLLFPVKEDDKVVKLFLCFRQESVPEGLLCAVLLKEQFEKEELWELFISFSEPFNS